MQINSRDFSYVLCPGSMPDSRYEKMYTDVFQCWNDVWSSTYSELNVGKKLYSDSFTRQDYVGALFHKNTCFALTFFRWANALRPEFSQDSYFSNWQPDHQKVLRSRGDDIIVCSQFTVHPYGRGKNLGISGKSLLTGMAVETFLNSKADAMTGAVRVDRGVNAATESWGAYVIDRKVPSDFGDNNTDLVGFFKDYISEQPTHELNFIVKELWNRRIVIPRKRIGLEFEHTESLSNVVA